MLTIFWGITIHYIISYFRVSRVPRVPRVPGVGPITIYIHYIHIYIYNIYITTLLHWNHPCHSVIPVTCRALEAALGPCTCATCFCRWSNPHGLMGSMLAYVAAPWIRHGVYIPYFTTEVLSEYLLEPHNAMVHLEKIALCFHISSP